MYVVELYREIDEFRAEGSSGVQTELVLAWVEVARVAVPPRTKMATVRDRAAEALHESGHALGEGPWRLRACPVGGMEPFVVRAQTDVRLEIEFPA